MAGVVRPKSYPRLAGTQSLTTLFHGKSRSELTAEPVGENKYRKLAACHGRQPDVDLRQRRGRAR